MKLGIKVVWTKVESDGGLYQSGLKIFVADEEVRPEALFADLDGIKLNNVLMLKKTKDKDGDPCMIVTNGNAYVSDYMYIGVGDVFKGEVNCCPNEKEVQALMAFFEEIKKEFIKATSNLKAETLVYKF